ncbi:ribonuclease E inhibitor RraB [Erythrobacter crassostreae]|uniref:Ribonuclease E inhibitor RraB n=1 Tax=Erythrobacter crassostreae TaxID=2828328 RepID=A0A9X1JJR4_9SPHN|nr:ribonuclease E inhibitor RraB [Erythrobacter crassostrea]MBV7258220.1 ribonuclease E inhibitor RraB [Erythrobacter crassostrea]
MTLLDENQAVLTQIAGEGSDLSKSRVVDFEHVFPNEEAASRFAPLATAAGWLSEVWQTDDGEWNVTARATLVPTAKGITEIEAHLDELARKVGGKADGWGFFRTN